MVLFVQQLGVGLVVVGGKHRVIAHVVHMIGSFLAGLRRVL